MVSREKALNALVICCGFSALVAYGWMLGDRAAFDRRERNNREHWAKYNQGFDDGYASAVQRSAATDTTRAFPIGYIGPDSIIHKVVVLADLDGAFYGDSGFIRATGGDLYGFQRLGPRTFRLTRVDER